MIRLIKFALGLAAAVVVHAAVVRIAPQAAQGVDLFLVAVVLYGLDGNSRAALFGGLVAGMVQDALTGGLFGLYGFADTVIGYAAARSAQRLVIERATGVVPVVAVAAVVQQAIVVGLAYVLLPDPRFPDPRWLAVRAALCGVVGMVVYAVDSWWRGGAAERRQRRMQKLHMD